MKLDALVSPALLLLSLTCSAEAGFIVGIVVDVVATVSEVAAEAVAGSAIAESCGIAASSCWYGEYVIVNGALYAGSNW
jgi:hypothetical protein